MKINHRQDILVFRKITRSATCIVRNTVRNFMIDLPWKKESWWRP